MRDRTKACLKYQDLIEIKKILKLPFGDQMEKYSRHMQILVASLYNVNDTAHTWYGAIHQIILIV